MFTVKVTRVPGLTKEVTAEGALSAQECMTLAEIELGPQDELRFNGAPVSSDHQIADDGVLTIARTIKSN